jgi:hypothetical protein
MFNLKSLSFLIATLTLTACGSSDDNNIDEQPVVIVDPVFDEAGPFTFFLQTTGDVEPEYLITQEEISVASLSADGTGFEQQGWNFVYNVGNTVFISGYENFEALSYKVDTNGDVAPLASFVFDSALEMFGAVDESVLLASDQSRDGAHTARTLYTVDAETGLVTDKINYTIFDDDTGTPGEGSVAWASGLVVRDNLLYVPFHKLDDQGFFSTPDPDNAYVAIYDYPLADGAAPNKIISDNRASNIGVNGQTSSMVTAENGDLYTMSSGALSAGFSPASTLPSAILRINSGETEFDADYYFNVEDAPNGGKLFWYDYVGDNKVIARIITDEEGAAVWEAYGKTLITQKLVIIDLVNQTVTDVAGVPLHSKQYTGPIEVIDGTVYVSIENAETAFVYEVDIDSSTAVVGAEIEGKSIKGFYDLYH